MTSMPSTRRQLDGVPLWSITTRSSQPGRVLAGKGLSEEVLGAPDSLICAQVVRDALAHLADRDRFFEAPEVLPPRDHPVYRDALPGPPITSSTDVEARLEAVNAWLARHDDAAAAFLERVNGKAIVPGEGDAIVVSDDVACGTLGCGGL